MLYPTPDHYLYNLIAMTSSEAKRLWRRSIKEHFDCTCVYCGETYDLSQLTIDHVHPRSRGGGDQNNVVCACSRCNQEKGSSHWKEFIAPFNNPLREQLITNYTNG
jgi:5-methylcytosine-specific restriction endonuclease McrA